MEDGEAFGLIHTMQVICVFGHSAIPIPVVAIQIPEPIASVKRRANRHCVKRTCQRRVCSEAKIQLIKAAIEHETKFNNSNVGFGKDNKRRRNNELGAKSTPNKAREAPVCLEKTVRYHHLKDHYKRKKKRGTTSPEVFSSKDYPGHHTLRNELQRLRSLSEPITEIQARKNSPAARRRRISVKSTNVRKYSKNLTSSKSRRVSTATASFNRSVTYLSPGYLVRSRTPSDIVVPTIRKHSTGLSSVVVPSRKLSCSIVNKTPAWRNDIVRDNAHGNWEAQSMLFSLKHSMEWKRKVGFNQTFTMQETVTTDNSSSDDLGIPRRLTRTVSDHSYKIHTTASEKKFKTISMKVSPSPCLYRRSDNEKQTLKSNTAYISQYLYTKQVDSRPISRSVSVKSTTARFTWERTQTPCQKRRNSGQIFNRKNRRSLSLRRSNTVKSDYYSRRFSDNVQSIASLKRRNALKKNEGTLFDDPCSTPKFCRVLSSRVVSIRRSSSTVSKVALGRKPSNAFLYKRPARRCSEPFLLDPMVLQNRTYRKPSSCGRYALPSSSKQKLHELAKDELLASLNLPLANDSRPADVLLDEKLGDEKNDLPTEKERKEWKRMHVIEEILLTEKNYISCLETLNAVFKCQLEESNIIAAKELRSLFPPQLTEICSSHTWFMQEMEERMENNNWRGIIGDIFAKMTSAKANLLEIYTNYVNSFPKSISTLSKCTRSSQKFRKFLEDCYENPLVERLDLPSFLLSPVQRLPRYILLLRELLKYTDDDHPDMYFIHEAKNEMEAMITSLNSSIHSSMEFYSASERRRKKMSRHFTSKKRKHRSPGNLSLRSSKKEESKTSFDADQGYYSERKDESPEDENGSRADRSLSMVSMSIDETKNNVWLRKRKESGISRNFNARKSWRRSLGAVFSNLWSTKDENSEEKAKPRSESDVPTTKSEFLVGGEEKSMERKLSSVKRKLGVSTTSTKTPDIHVDNLDVPINTSQEELKRKCSSSSTSSSLRPTSPQNFKRNRLRGSAGPVFRSIFQRNKLHKALSWNEINTNDVHVDKKQRRSISLKKTASSKENLDKHSSKRLSSCKSASIKSLIHSNIPFMKHSHSEDMGSSLPVNCNIDNDLSMSNSDFHKCSSQSLCQHSQTQLNNNEESSKTIKEKRSRFMQTFKHFVHKK